MTDKHAHKEEYPLKHYRKLRKLVRRKKADVEESAENSFSIDAINDISHDEIVQTDSEEDDTETDGFFLQPVPIKLRRSLLKLSGVRKVDNTEREECKELRGSREVCGCDCERVCIAETCLCAINGIQCQVDRFGFPCGCMKKGCENPSGRIEFNANKVLRHYKHTMTRLRYEEAQEQDNPTEQMPKESQTCKTPKHIRFTDDGDTVEGEPGCFNSTESGCCLDCSLTVTSSCTTSDLQSAQSSVGSLSLPCLSHQVVSNTDHCMFGNFSDFSDELAPSPVVLNTQSESSDLVVDDVLEPISGMLNPILNTVDSLDMYSFPHVQQQQPVVAVGDELDPCDNVIYKWQSLSHESLLTTNSLIPMKDSDDSSSAGSSDQDGSLEFTDEQTQSLSFTSLKPPPVSFQLHSSHNVVHAMRSEFDEMEQHELTLTQPPISAGTNSCLPSD